MAINFLNNVDLNQNQLLKASIENIATVADPLNGVLGQLVFKTNNNTLKVCTTASPTAAVYSAVGGGGDVDSITVADSTFVDLVDSGTAADPILTASLSAVDGTDTTTRFLSKDNVWAVPPQGDITSVLGGTYITVTDGTGPSPSVAHDSTTRTDTTSTQTPAFGGTFTTVSSLSSNAQGHVTAINIKTVTLPTPTANTNTTYSFAVPAATTTLRLAGSDAVNDDIALTGTANKIVVTRDSDASLTFKLADGTLAASANLVLPTDTTLATNLAAGDNTQRIATTKFVQAALTGLMQFKGGFNASTGILADGSGDDLYTDVALEVGDFYVATVSGNFFSNAATPLTPGDSVFVQTAANAGAAVEGDFVVVQSDTDLATATTPGIGFTKATTTAGIDVSYAAADGSAALSLDVNELAVSTAPTHFAGNNAAGATNKYTVSSLFSDKGKALTLSAGTGIAKVVAGGVTTYTITLADAWQIGGASAGVVGTNVQVELIEVANGQTVYAQITRTSTTIAVAFTGTITDTEYKVLLNNIA